ncbi:MAG: ROK family protein [Bacteroidetes bacterium]|nr:ROK family protein [Bacteroidota bacterium]
MNLGNSNIISVNSKVVRSVNRAMILNLIRERQPISRIKISRISGLNKSTVSSIVSDLLNEELIYEKMKEDQNIGRNPLDLYLRLGKYFVGAVNIDSATTRFAIADIDGSLISKSSVPTESSNPEGFVEFCMDNLLGLCEKSSIKNLEAIGVSITGIVDSKNHIVSFAPNIGWENVNIGAIIRKKCPEISNVSVGNDAKSSALAELWFGKHDLNLSNFVFLSIGPGIGSGIVVENRLLEGEYNASGEFGHTTLFEEGNKCVCGNLGCWEAYASERATVARYISKVNNNSGKSVDVIMQDIIELALNKDKVALETLQETGRYLGIGISNIIKSIDPHAIIMGGKIIQVWDVIYPEIIEIVQKRAFSGNAKNINILPTSLKVRPRLLGAATMAIKTIFDDYKITA